MGLLLQLSCCTALALVLCGRGAARCPNTPPADCSVAPARWRRIDGSCNNPKDPTRGRADTPLGRVLKPRYADGVHAPRQSVSGQPLPSPRVIVTRLMPDRDVPSMFTNHLVMNWAQLVSHDVSRIHASLPRANSSCCRVSGPTDSCAPILIPDDDPFFGRFGVNCLGLNRSVAAPCHHPYYEQNNVVTHFLDASFTYGSHPSTMFRLRTMKGGLLKVSIIDGEDFLPNGEAGDSRVGITPMITSIQTLFLREHNRIAGALWQLNPHWKDERVFQEARRVVIAQWQLLTYRDWLQWIIGADVVMKNSLLPVESGFSRDYDPLVDPSTSNDFTSAAYRAFHSIVQNNVWLGGADEKGNPHQQIPLSEAPASLVNSSVNFRRVIEGMLYEPRQMQDQFMAEEITFKLFRGSKPFGTDLVSTDIMRGREHGLPGYNEYRVRCNMPRATSWQGFRDSIPEQNIQVLQSLYSHPDDVDYYVGGIAETVRTRRTDPLASITSPVFQCILVDQFRRWKVGDRFFFDRAGPSPGFTEAQLEEIRKQTMSRMICDNTRGMSFVPEDAFLRLGVLGNRDVRCADLAGMRFDPWKEASP